MKDYYMICDIGDILLCLEDDAIKSLINYIKHLDKL